MSKLNIDQKTVKELFSGNKADFLIPDYQRPYAWGEDECDTLWDDLFAFAFPEDDCDKFDKERDEYFLGPIVTFRNDENNKRLEVIDGQQRLTTLMLLLRAFYSRFGKMKDQGSLTTSELIAKCIWKTNEYEVPDMENLKIDSEVASDNDKEEFFEILRSGEAPDRMKSRYAKSFRFFKQKIDSLVNDYPSYTPLFAMRILNNVILLPIEAESQVTALRIFSTLNDRGLPLSDADIFKSQLYKYYSQRGEKDAFITRWKKLEETCSSAFAATRVNPVDELFTRYMYFERACQGNKKTTTEGMRDFYERDDYQLLKTTRTFDNLEALAEFWNKVNAREDFGEEVSKRLSILLHAPNSMWTYLVSTYFLTNKTEDGLLDETAFSEFLSIITGFLWAYSIHRPGSVNAFRVPVYPELIEIVNGNKISFDKFKFNRDELKNELRTFSFTNQRPITRSMLAWWAFQDPNQQPLLEEPRQYEIEHIFAKNRSNFEGALSNQRNLEALGNKSLLERGINKRASDYRFADKAKRYLGKADAEGKPRRYTQIAELIALAESKEDFTESDIEARTERILNAFLDELDSLNLLTE